MKITISALSIFIVGLTLALSRVFIPFIINTNAATFYEPAAPMRVVEGIVYCVVAWSALCFAASHFFYNRQLSRGR